MTRSYAPLTLLLVALLAMSLLAGCNEDDVERSLGKQTSAAVEKEFGLNQDPVLAEYINTLGQRLVGQSKRQHIPYHFRVINTDMVNAFAAPWGYIYVTEGMLRFAQSEDELAFIMGHEVGHVANRDSIKSFKKSILFNVGLALLGSKSETWANVGGIGAGLLMLSYSRDDERDSDVSGSTFAYAAGYDPAGGIAFFDRLMKEIEKDRPSSIEHIFLTHPPTADRIAAEKKRPELNLSDPAVASRIGRSYARRYEYGTACTYYQQALQQKPEATQTRLAYAEALRGQGLRDRALSECQAILQREPQNASASSMIASLQAPPPALLPTPPAEREQATAALALAHTVSSDAAALSAVSSSYNKTMQPLTAGVSGITRGSISGLLEISNQNVTLADAGQEAYLRASQAVSSANQAAFSLENLNGSMGPASALVRANAGGLTKAIGQAQAGEARPGDVAVYRRALLETQLAASQLRMAMTQATAVQPLVLNAGRSAQDTVSLVNTMVQAPDPDRHAYNVNNAAADTGLKAAQAAEAVGKIKTATTTAEARALLAKLNLAALGASPELREMYDGMTAHYCHVSPREVAALRRQGLGFGDAAFVLIAARTRSVPPDSLAGLALGPDSLIDGLRRQGFVMNGPVALLRFLSYAMDRETAARNG